MVARRLARAGRSAANVAAEVAVAGPAGPLLRRIGRILVKAVKRGWDVANGGEDATARAVLRGALTTASEASSVKMKLALGVLAYAWVNGRRNRRVRARRAAATAATRALRTEGIRRLIDRVSWLPRHDWVSDESWLAEGVVEQVEWLNNAISTAWPFVSKAVESTVRKVLEPMLDNDKPKGINSMKFDTFTLGTMAPRLEHVVIVPPDEADEIQIQTKVTWKGNPNIVFRVEGPAIYGGLSPVKIAVTDLVVMATAKITLAHLFREVPVVGGLQITLTEDPYIAYGVNVKAAPGMPALSLNSIPGLQGAIVNALTNILREHVVFPKSVNVVVASDQTPATVRSIEDALEVTPVGKLYVTVRGAKKLKNAEMFGTSDPYALVALGSRKVPPASQGAQRTKTVNNSLNPTWDESFVLDVCSTELQCLWVRVFDDDDGYGADDVMGSVVLPLASLPPNQDVRSEYVLRKQANLQKRVKANRGTITFDVKYVPNDVAGLNASGFSPPSSPAGMVSAWSSARTISSFASSFSRKQKKTQKTNSKFQAEICRFLGLEPDARVLHEHMANDDGSLEYLKNGRLKSLLKTLPARMDLCKGLPLWAAYPDFSRVRFINELMLTIWPYASAAVKRECELLNADVLPKMMPRGVWAKAKADIGTIPPTIEAVRMYGLGGDEILMEWAVKIAGDQQGGGAFGVTFLPACRMSCEMSEMQFMAVMRVRIRPLIPRLPLVAGVSVSVIGEPVVDGAMYVKVPFLPKLDMGSLPGMGLIKKAVTGPIMTRAGRYPSVAHIPILDFKHPAVKQLTSGSKGTGQHVITVKVKGARNLHATDWGGVSDPYAVVVMAGEARYAERQRQTAVVENTLTPRWEKEFTFPLTDIDDAGEIMIAVFDSDGKTLVSKAMDPKKLAENIRPVKHFHERSLELAKRFQLGIDSIPWDPTFYKYVLATTPPGKTPSMSTQMKRKLTEARVADIARRAAKEPPVPPRPKTEAQLKAEEEEAKKMANESKKKMKSSSSKKAAAADESKNVAAFDPNRVVSDVEQCITNQTVLQDNDLLGMTLVDFKSILQPGRSTTMWFEMDGCPSEQLEGEDEMSPKKGKKKSITATAQISRALSNTSPKSKPQVEEGTKGKPEIELELSWSVFNEVRPLQKTKSTKVEDGGEDGDSDGVTEGTLHVEVLRATNLQKPILPLKGKMSSDTVMPQVQLSVGLESVKTTQARGVNPTFNEHFDFPHITSLDELTLSVVHPASKKKDRFMGTAVVPLHTVVKSGSISGSYALEGVKNGEVFLNIMFRAKKSDKEIQEDIGRAIEAKEADGSARTLRFEDGT